RAAITAGSHFTQCEPPGPYHGGLLCAEARMRGETPGVLINIAHLGWLSDLIGVRPATTAGPGRFGESAGKEVANGRGDLRGVGFQREMPGVEEADNGVRDVALERLGARRQEERVVLAPHREERRLVSPEILLEGRVERDVALVVAEQVELHLGCP